MPCGLSARTFVHHAFYSSTGKSPPPRAIGKINPLRERAQKSKTSPRPGGQFCLQEGGWWTGGEGSQEGGGGLEVIHKPIRHLVGLPAWPLNEVSASEAQPGGAWTRKLGE